MSLLQDLRHAVRTARKTPAFTAIAILSLALGIGANTAIFSVVEAVVLRSLPYHDASRICLLWKSVPAKSIAWDWSSYPMIRDWRDRNHVFTDLAIILRPEGSQMILTAGAEPQRIQAAKVTANLFPILGSTPALGRTFTEDEEKHAARVAVVSYGFWKRNGSTQVLELDHEKFTVIGVMPPAFQFPDPATQVWTLLSQDTRWPTFQRVRVADAFTAVGRLKPGVTLDRARAQMSTIAAALAHEHADTDAGSTIRVIPLPEQIAGPRLRTTLWILFAAVLCVLLIACANVANLLLARGAARQQEFAIRAALGAGRARLIRQLLTESLLLSTTAAIVGLALGWVALRVLIAMAPANLPRLDGVHLNPAILVFVLVISLASGLVFGLAPAWQSTRLNQSAARVTHRTRGLFVALEYAIAVALLAAAGLLLRSFERMETAELGFEPRHILTMTLDLHANASYEQAIERIEALPGVERAAVGNVLADHIPNNSIAIEGRPTPDGSQSNVRYVVTPEYFDLMRIPLLQGRLLAAADTANSPPVAIINQTMQRRFWPDGDAIGKRFAQALPGQGGARWITVVGIVRDHRRNGRESDVVPAFYEPLRQWQWPAEMGLLVRTASDPASLASAVRRIVRSIEPTAPYFEITTVEDQLANLEQPRRFQTTLLTILAGLALTLSAIGIYALLHYSVAQRKREIGIRLALGAQSIDLLTLIAGQGLRWALAGLTAGTIASLALTRVLRSMLYGISATDPVTFLGAIALLLVVASVSAALPARAASRVDPLAAINPD
ncbi:MAG TPA: ABC transporter permease [Bryobacteraceae bacterium]|nr:ABC transporter permease [Bryobacteraceae bacterium]